MKPDPENFDPQASPNSGANTTTTITADIIKTDFDVSAANYTITIKPKAAASPEPPPTGKLAVQQANIDPIDPPPFPSPPIDGPMERTFQGNLTFSGDVAKVSKVWDGKSDSGGNFPDGDCTIELHAVAAGANGTVTDDEVAEVAKGVLLLQVKDGSKVVATSRQDEQDKLLRKVLIPRSGPSPEVLIVVNGVAGNPANLTATVRSQTSGQSHPVTLQRQANSSYEGTLALDKSFIRQDGLIGTLSGASPKLEVWNYLASLQTSSPTFLGACVKTVPSSIALKSTATTVPDNIRAGGFEHVTVTLSRQPGVTKPTEIAFKTRHQARTLVWLGHGYQDGTFDFDTEGGPPSRDSDPMKDLIPGDNFGEGDLLRRSDGRPSVEKIFFLGCNVLDLYDFNNNRHSDALTAPRAQRSAPGLAWWRATGGRVNLMGYNFPVLTPDFEKAFASYAQSPSSPSVALAWMRANLFNPEQSTTRNACAWDDHDYYYIPFRRLRSGQPVYTTARQVYKVARVDPTGWSRDTGWGQYPPRKSVALPTNIKIEVKP